MFIRGHAIWHALCWTSELNIQNGQRWYVIISLIALSVHITCYASVCHTPVNSCLEYILADQMFTEKVHLDRQVSVAWRNSNMWIIAKSQGIMHCFNTWFLWSSVFGYRKTELWCANCSGSDSIIFAIDSVWETTQPATCRYYTIIKTAAIGLVLPPFSHCPGKPVYCDQTFFLSLHALQMPGPQD